MYFCMYVSCVFMRLCMCVGMYVCAFKTFWVPRTERMCMKTMCMYVCVCVYVYVHVRKPWLKCMYVSAGRCVCTCVCMYMCVCFHLWTHNQYIKACKQILRAPTQAYIHTHSRTYAHTHTCKHPYIHIHIHTYIQRIQHVLLFLPGCSRAHVSSVLHRNVA